MHSSSNVVSFGFGCSFSFSECSCAAAAVEAVSSSARDLRFSVNLSKAIAAAFIWVCAARGDFSAVW